MSEKTEKTEKPQRRSWFKGLRSEFGKITWPDRNELATQTTAVVVVSVLLGILIAIVDTIMKYGIDFLVR